MVQHNAKEVWEIDAAILCIWPFMLEIPYNFRITAGRCVFG